MAFLVEKRRRSWFTIGAAMSSFGPQITVYKRKNPTKMYNIATNTWKWNRIARRRYNNPLPRNGMDPMWKAK